MKVNCGALRLADAGSHVELNGWMNRRRDHGGLIFVDVRDRDGVTQIVFDPKHPSFALAETLRHEDVLRVRGAVRRRPAGTENAKIETGEVEVAADELEVLSRSLVPPFQVNLDEDVDENLRMQYRYLDLRRPRMQRNLTIRHKIVKAIRDFFDSRNFLEIETPLLVKSTPEGAREYLVPSRIHPGSFYALPQSPQILKQILMIAGFGRYMQIARCMRDEDLRADRQPEFTQLDVEMSFVSQDDVLEIMESAMIFVWQQALGIPAPGPFPRYRHEEVLARYGTDKPDLRFGLELVDVKETFRATEFKVFRDQAESRGGAVIAVRYPGGATLSRRDFDGLTELAKQLGAKGLVWIALASDGVKSPVSKFLSDADVAAVAGALAAQTGDALLLFADERARALDVSGRMRNEIGSRCNLRDPGRFAFAWVTDFPLFEVDPDTGKPAPAHHPFTAPNDDQWELLESDPLAMRAQHYDLVLNGFELGSGSIRIHKPDFQRKIFAMLGMSDEEIEERFGFFIRALDYGAPPHGGMALGIDRIAMLAAGEENLREVIAFPKTQVARDLMMDAPTPVPERLLRDLSLKSTAPPPKD
ncbi:MAG: aspartate--tRNA ligase [Candidatus Eremiobacteraeota bacterium]|nr:aspartate--tRNA ligase [Candidatus Eremiobacteraeota bacterium]